MVKSHREVGANSGPESWGSWSNTPSIPFNRHSLTCQVIFCFCSVTKLCLTVCDPMQHTQPPCPSLSPGVCPSSCQLSRCCYPTISSCATLFSFCHQSFPALGSFAMSQLFASGSISPSNEYSGLISFRIDWFDPLAVQGTLESFIHHHN